MKKIIYFIGMLFTLVNVSSCMQDEVIEFESDEQLKLESTGYSCSGGNHCLPKVSIFGTENYATINLTYEEGFKDEGENNHRFTFKIWDASGYIYKEDHSLPANAMLSYRFPSSPTYETYTVLYSITCNNCNSCSNKGSIQISRNGDIHSGTTLDCFKNYVDYSAQLGINKSIIARTNSSLLSDSEHYMNVNNVRIYKLVNGKKEQTHHYASFSASYNEIIISNPPSESNSQYQIEFYNDICLGNTTHYLYLVYNTYMPGEIRLEQTYLQEHKEH